jgi:hypothetical protein
MKIHPQVMHSARASIVDKLKACESQRERRANPAISTPIVPFGDLNPRTNIEEVGARKPDGERERAATSIQICSPGAQDSCLVKRPIGPLGCRVIYRPPARNSRSSPAV